MSTRQLGIRVLFACSVLAWAPSTLVRAQNFDTEEAFMQEIGQALMGSFSPQAASDMQNEFTQYLSGSSNSPLIVQGGGMWDGLPSTDYSWLNTSSLLSSLNLPPEDWLSSTVSMVEGEFCDGDYIIRGGKIPAVLLGPEFNITLDTGSCEVVSSHDHTDKTLMCTGPSVSYAKTPITFKSKHFRFDKFIGKQCALGKTFGIPTDIVLYDGGKDQHFKDVTAFMEALSGGTLSLWGIPESDAVASGIPTSGNGASLLGNVLPNGWTLVQAKS